jgi:hypothetical protein
MLKKHFCPSLGSLKPFAFRRSKRLIDAERLVIPANEPESRKKGYIDPAGCRIEPGMTE